MATSKHFIDRPIYSAFPGEKGIDMRQVAKGSSFISKYGAKAVVNV